MSRVARYRFRPEPEPEPRPRITRYRPEPKVDRLRQVISEAAEQEGYSLKDLTVLSDDPYRQDTPVNHSEGSWLARQMQRVKDKIHQRGLHYVLISGEVVLKPGGQIYRNTDKDWQWLQNAVKAARWLGYVPFDRISDARNDEPLIYRAKWQLRATWELVPGEIVDVLDIRVDLNPSIRIVDDPANRQPCALVMFGEKRSLEDVALPLAVRYSVDLYLGTGETSDTMLYQIASDVWNDAVVTATGIRRRRLIVFTLCDCDPAGYQMTTSIARKLQAMRDLFFPELEFEVHAVALTVKQVRELGLPSTPLKESEQRADRWRELYGVDQTEIDALATLDPDTLTDIIREAIEPYFDATLARRERDWWNDANDELMARVDAPAIAELEAEAATAIDGFREQVEAINRRAEELAEVDLDLPEIPEAEKPDPRVTPLISTDMTWVEATRILVKRKRLEKADDDEDDA